MIESDEYLEAACPIMKVWEVFDIEMEATNPASFIFDTEEMIKIEKYFEAAGPIMKAGELFDEVTLTD